MGKTTNNFPGIYPNGDGIIQRKPGLKLSDYFKSLYEQKLDKQYTPNTVYAVDENGKQVMMEFSEFIDDAPADNKQYARENKQWEEVKLQKVKLENTVVNTIDWIEKASSDDYPFEYRIMDDRIKSTMIPTVIFSEEDALSSNFSPICESFDGYVSIYAHKVPETELTIPVITLQ